MPNSQDLNSLVRSINNQCPHLRILLSPTFDANDTLLFSLMEAIVPQKLQKVHINSSDHTLPHAVTRAAFLRHSASLREVDVWYTRGMSSMDLREILEICDGLEVFGSHSDLRSGDTHLTLADAISVPWAASKTTRHLEINIELLGTPQTPYYRRAVPTVLSEVETHQFADLERFYRKIGSLAALEFLDLRNVIELSSSGFLRECMEDNSFPAMLSLPDSKTRKPGYLDLLSGWRRQKTLRGSVKVGTDETMVTVGEREVEWFLKHWPALERAGFSFRAEDVR